MSMISIRGTCFMRKKVSSLINGLKSEAIRNPFETGNCSVSHRVESPRLPVAAILSFLFFFFFFFFLRNRFLDFAFTTKMHVDQRFPKNKNKKCGPDFLLMSLFQSFPQIGFRGEITVNLFQ